MNIERDNEGIKFHTLGTLHSLTRWITSHDEGLAEWLKNVRRAYQADRADVPDEHRVAVILMRDQVMERPSALAVLDVGGATAEDVKAWSIWQDFNASSRGSQLVEEETQGNGAKAYMYKMFNGTARILGVKFDKLNCKGFDGPIQSEDRGHPGFIPDVARGSELPVGSWQSELASVLAPYDVRPEELPREVKEAISKRRAFTLVEGIGPKDLYKGKIPKDLLVVPAAQSIPYSMLSVPA